MKNEILDKKNYFKAMEVINALAPVFKQLDEVSPIVSALTQADSRFSNIESMLSAASGALNELSLTLQSVTHDDKQQAGDRGMMELMRLCNNRLAKIPDEMAWERRKLTSAIGEFDSLFNDLIKRGYSADQAERVLVDSPRPSAESYYAKHFALEAEQSALETFCKDFPRYDQSFLAGTRFANWSKDSLNSGMAALARLCAERVKALNDKVEWSRKKFKIDMREFKSGNTHQPDEAAHLLYVSQLEVEAEKLTAFIASSESWDKALLVGTFYEDWEPESLAA